MLLVTAVVDRLCGLGGVSLVGASRKRKVSTFASMVSSERLEERAMLSAVMETGASVEVASPHHSKPSKPSKASFPDLLDTYTATVQGNLPVDPGTGTATITQKNTKSPSFKAVVEFTEVQATFTFNGKFAKTTDTISPVAVTGKVTGTIQVPGSGSKTLKIKANGTGKATINPIDTTAFDVTVTVPKDIKVLGQVVVKGGTVFTLKLTGGASGSATTAKKEKPSSLPAIEGSYDTELFDENFDIDLFGTTEVTFEKGGKVKAVTTFSTDDGDLIATFTGKLVKGSTDTLRGTTKVKLPDAKGKLKTVSLTTTITATANVDDVGDPDGTFTLDAVLTSKKALPGTEGIKSLTFVATPFI